VVVFVLPLERGCGGGRGAVVLPRVDRVDGAELQVAADAVAPVRLQELGETASAQVAFAEVVA
jgi:hypothetical protein